MFDPDSSLQKSSFISQILSSNISFIISKGDEVVSFSLSFDSIIGGVISEIDGEDSSLDMVFY